MGAVFSSKSVLKQVLLVGPQGSGKTTLLYAALLHDKPFNPTPTQGYNYEELDTPLAGRLALWDLGGSPSVLTLMFNRSLL